MFRANRSVAAGCTETAGCGRLMIWILPKLQAASIRNHVVMTKGPVTAGTFHVRSMPEMASIRTVEKIAPATTYPHSRGVGAKKVGRAHPTRMPL